MDVNGRYVDLDLASEAVKQVRGLDWENDEGMQYQLGPWLHRTDVLDALQNLPTHSLSGGEP